MTCGKKLQKNCIPCQTVYNQLEPCELPKEFRDIRRLEKVLVARRLLFKKISIIPKGQSPKLKGALCNVPIDVVDICNTLPRPADSNGIVIVKLKRKLQYRGHVYFESVRPDIIFRLLQYLKLNNSLYHDIEIDVKNIPSFLIEDKRCDNLPLVALNNINIDDKIPLIVEKNNSSRAEVEGGFLSIPNNIPIPISLENCNDNQDSDPTKTEGKVETDGINSHHNIADPVDFRIDGIVDINGERNLDSTFFERINNNSNIESNENSLNAYRCSANETVLLNTSSENEFISIAPGENVIAESLLDDKFCEELSHPLLFSTGKFGFQFKRKVELSPTNYFNQRLLNYTQKFSSDSDYIFFCTFSHTKA